MHLDNYWICFEGAIPSNICNEIIHFGCNKQVNEARIGKSIALENLQKIPNPSSEQLQEISHLKYIIKKTRNSKVSWLDEPWVHRWLDPFIEESNHKNWKFDIDEYEDYQFTIYEGSEKQHYDWHRDILKTYDENHIQKRWRNKTRKLSAVVQLTDPSEYEGGNFWINYGEQGPGEKPIEIKIEGMKKKGSVLVFPSFLYHKVEPVTFGTRYSLVNWTLGDNFK
jgi:PKHD-type hydroxylase